MSRQSSKSDTLRNAMLAIAVFLTVMIVGPKLLPPPKQPAQDIPGVTPGAPQTPQIAPGGGDWNVVATTPGTAPQASGEADAGFQIVEAQSEATVTIGSAPFVSSKDHAADPYRMSLTLSNIGAAIESATMTDHAESLGSEDRYQLLRTLESADGRRFRSLAIEKINIDKVDLFLHDKQWTLKTWSVTPVRLVQLALGFARPPR
ncbi:MAG: hypothetical protein IIC02_05485, partial [Planctomycetes bacterium]|nr:hypothetical protein [Planctomycetota bacterium]